MEASRPSTLPITPYCLASCHGLYQANGAAILRLESCHDILHCTYLRSMYCIMMIPQSRTRNKEEHGSHLASIVLAYLGHSLRHTSASIKSFPHERTNKRERLSTTQPTRNLASWQLDQLATARSCLVLQAAPALHLHLHLLI